MSSSFSTTLSAKWILAGEHAVVRQRPALVYPLPYYQFTLTHQDAGDIKPGANLSDEQHKIHSQVMQTIEHGLSILGSDFDYRSGIFNVFNTIPVGCGLGASAALCLAVAQWLAHRHLIDNNHIFPIAMQLENRFHGQSSGLDIIGAGARQGYFYQAGQYETIPQTWQPYWYFSMSKLTSHTDQCVQKVQKLWQTNPALAADIDVQMTQSVKLAYDALTQPEAAGLQKLAQAIDSACDCFQRWELLNTALQTHMQSLKEAGALACKPTGSGGGGGVISLWPCPAPDTLTSFIPLQPLYPTDPEEIQYDD